MDHHSQIANIFEYFGVSNMTYSNKVWVGPCPVHDGQDCNFKVYEPGFKSYDEGGEVSWKCYSRGCQVGRQGLRGLVKALWGNRPGHPPWNLTAGNYKPIPNELKTFYKEVRAFQDVKEYPAEQLPELEPISPYFLSRGYSPHVLNVYGVGDCRAGFYKDRAVVPIRDQAGKLVGSCGRSIHKQCHLCGTWHGGFCPDMEKRRHYGKWTNLPNCPIHDLFLGLDIIADEVCRTRTIVLTEGSGDAMRLYDGGVLNATCIFGVEISRAQIDLLARLGAMNVVLALDDDEAGQNGRNGIAVKLGSFYNVVALPTPLYTGKKDIGDLRDVAEIKRFVEKYAI